MRLESHPEISAGWKRTVAEWYAHGETMPALKEGIPLGLANRFAASCHFGVGGGEWGDTSLVGNEVRIRFRLALRGVGPL